MPEAGTFLTKLFILRHLDSITKSGAKHHDSIIVCMLVVSKGPVSIQTSQRVYVVGSDVLGAEGGISNKDSNRDKIQLT